MKIGRPRQLYVGNNKKTFVPKGERDETGMLKAKSKRIVVSSEF